MNDSIRTSWVARGTAKPVETFELHVTSEGVHVAGAGTPTLHPLEATEVGLGKWTGDKLGCALVLGHERPFRVGAEGVHYSLETRPPQLSVDAILEPDAFLEMLEVLQAAWFQVHPLAQNYRQGATHRPQLRQVYDLHRIPIWLLPLLAGLIALAVVAVSAVSPSLLFWALSLLPFFGIGSVSLVSKWLLTRPSHRLELHDSWVTLRRGDNVMAQATRDSLSTSIAPKSAQVRLGFPDGQEFTIEPYAKFSATPFGLLPGGSTLHVTPHAAEVLRRYFEGDPLLPPPD